MQHKDTTWVVQDNQLGYFILSDSLQGVVSRPFLKVKGQLNKEISPLLNISVRGVETLRYRLRKKLDLEHEDNLQEFLTELV